MQNETFLDDFEITEHTAKFHEILGRCLILATRFDNLVKNSAIFLDMKIEGSSIVKQRMSEDEYDKYIDKLFEKSRETRGLDKDKQEYRTLNSNISELFLKADMSVDNLEFDGQSLKKAINNLKKSLHKARRARNDVAHTVSIGFEGCLDHINLDSFKQDTIIPLIKKIAKGDYIISLFMSALNKEPLPSFTENDYCQKIIHWVIDTEDT
jgi:hypothetical protein